MIAPTHEKSMWSLGGLWGQVFGVIFGVRLRLLWLLYCGYIHGK